MLISANTKASHRGLQRPPSPTSLEQQAVRLQRIESSADDQPPVGLIGSAALATRGKPVSSSPEPSADAAGLDDGVVDGSAMAGGPVIIEGYADTVVRGRTTRGPNKAAEFTKSMTFSARSGADSASSSGRAERKSKEISAPIATPSASAVASFKQLNAQRQSKEAVYEQLRQFQAQYSISQARDNQARVYEKLAKLKEQQKLLASEVWCLRCSVSRLAVEVAAAHGQGARCWPRAGRLCARQRVYTVQMEDGLAQRRAALSDCIGEKLRLLNQVIALKTR